MERSASGLRHPDGQVAALPGASGAPLRSEGGEAAGDEPRQREAPVGQLGLAAALPPLHRFPRMVHEYLVERVRRAEEAANRRRAAVRTRGDAEDYVRQVRERVQQCFAPWPDRTPLAARVTRVLERDTHRIENVIFESRPGFPVTANLYLPKGRQFPLPAVLGACGHDSSGKAANQFLAGLTQCGYVVLVFDPMGQGERIQHLSSDHRPRHGVGTSEHIYVGNRMLLTGDSLSSWFAWDGIRAVDYLLTRPEVDPLHIGVTGVSGGGTQTAWLCATDRRITMAAPSCWVTTFRRNLENEEIADPEQCPWRALSLGLDHSDFIAAMAPKPVLLLGQEKDFFDVRGLEEAFSRLKHLYALLGAEGNIQLHVDPGYHSYPKASREVMYAFFNRFSGVTAVAGESLLAPEEETALWCTSDGQVGTSGARNAFAITRARATALATRRGRIDGEPLRRAVSVALRLPPRPGAPDYRILRQGSARSYPKAFAASYAIETEDGVFALVYHLVDEELYSRPPRGPKRALLYVSHRSADEELRHEPLLAELIHAEPESAVYACDVRGTGESRPAMTRATFDDPYGSDYFCATYSAMLDYPYVGQKTHDVLRVLDWLWSCGHREVHLVAKGWGALPATFAALLSDAVVAVTLKNALSSFTELAQSEEYAWPLQSLLPGVLEVFDLPDCYRSLAAKGLRQLDPWGAAAGG